MAGVDPEVGLSHVELKSSSKNFNKKSYLYYTKLDQYWISLISSFIFYIY